MSAEPWWAHGNASHPHHRARRTFTSVILAAAVVAFFATLLPSGAPAKATFIDHHGVAVNQGRAALRAQCGPIFIYPPEQQTQTMAADLPDGITIQPGVQTIVPILGPTATKPADLTGRFYGPRAKKIPGAARLLRSMWDGLAVIYYTPSATKSEVDALRTLARTRKDLDVVVLPWRGPQALPVGRRFAFAAWGSSQSCHHVAVPAFEDFRTANPASKAPRFTVRPTPRAFTLSGQASETFRRVCAQPHQVCRIAVSP